MNPLLLEGLTDAVGFVTGVLIAYGVSMLLGFDPLSKVYDSKWMGGIVLAAIGGGLGPQIARRLRAAHTKKKSGDN